ncbi:MAG: peptidoglycan DD-metalloendopeptidase family protein [Hyphomicrobiales bacterium]|nr:peptidoglycan DD-metalloendopeptidase family protein [Hyphomicrobiales bacterium]
MLALLAAGAGAQEQPPDPSKKLRAVESELQRSARKRQVLEQQKKGLTADVRKLTADLVTVARRIQNRENAADALEDRIAGLDGEEKALRADLEARRAQFAVTIAALQRIARLPPEAMVAMGSQPTDTVRGAILLRAVLPQIEGEARKLRHSLARLDNLRMDAASQRGLLADQLENLQSDRAGLAALLAQKKRQVAIVTRRSRDEAHRSRKLAGRAKGLHDLLRDIERERQKQRDAAAKAKPAEDGQDWTARTAMAAAAVPPITGAKGRLVSPVAGRVVEEYGQSTAEGMTSKGIRIATRAGAQVVSPYGGRVVFAGAFRRYGQLLIIEHGEGYHSLLAGMARIDCVIGQQVIPGEPVGVMGGADAENRSLYLEFRRTGQPINPLPWMAARGGRTSG